MSRMVCIHGHFYQPPRENPQTGVIPNQPSASPFDNWNDRILKECYQANTSVEIVDVQGHPTILNNFDWISFNIGPTLFSWMTEHHPVTAQKIVEAHHRSLERTGHSNALAQAYHHSILPLADHFDKETEIRWGLADYHHHFGVSAEGMWLAETAVDTDTLEVLATFDVQFVVLAPRQAQAVCVDGDWTAVNEDTLDTSIPYLCELPSGRTITLYFYEPQLAMDVAFRGALNNGVQFAERIEKEVHRLSPNGLLHFATDGESYGHHHRHGEIALGFCLNRLLDSGVSLINYGAHLEQNPPTTRVKIVEKSSWSCVHGVGRWSENCGCVIDPALSGQQYWRTELRTFMNRLRDVTRTIYRSECHTWLTDPMMLRHRWKEAVLTGSERALVQEFLKEGVTLDDDLMDTIDFWMRQQELALKMFTSCGWFFDTGTGIEAQQLLDYAKELIRHTKQRVDWPFDEGIWEELRYLEQSQKSQWTKWVNSLIESVDRTHSPQS